MVNMITTQQTEILSHLLTRGSITPLDALALYGCFRLGARIFDLRRLGYNIETRFVGDKKKYAQYTLIRGPVASNASLAYCAHAGKSESKAAPLINEVA